VQVRWAHGFLPKRSAGFGRCLRIRILVDIPEEGVAHGKPGAIIAVFHEP
jgi:hypothetical protein